MSSKHLVCQGAICKCNFGTLPDKLIVKTQKRHYINDKEGKEKLTATNKEIGNPFEKNTFGNCSKLNNKPCKVTVTAWSGFYDKITIEDNKGKALLEDSKATCPIGSKDCISIINHGQIAELNQQNIKNSRPEVINDLCPFIELGEEGEQFHHLNFKINGI